MAVHGKIHKLGIAVIEDSSDGTDPENNDWYNSLTTNKHKHQHTQINGSPQGSALGSSQEFHSSHIELSSEDKVPDIFE